MSIQQYWLTDAGYRDYVPYADHVAAVKELVDVLKSIVNFANSGDYTCDTETAYRLEGVLEQADEAIKKHGGDT